jgi:hypothetical protein
MTNTSKNLILIICLFVCYFTEAEEHIIQFSRPYKIGEKYRKQEYYKTEITFAFIDDKNIEIKKQSKSFSIDYDGVETIRKLNNKGEILEIESKINKLELNTQGVKNTLIPKGKLLKVIDRKDKTIYKVDDTEIPPAIRQYLTDTISTNPPGEIFSSKILGINKKNKVGDKWDLDSKLMEKEIEHGIFDVSKVKGTVEFKKIVSIHNIKCMLLITEIEADIDHYKTTDTKVQHGIFKWKILSYLPLDQKEHIVKETQTLGTYLEFLNPDKPGWITKIRIEQQADKKYSNDI